MRTILPHESNPALRETSREIPIADISGTHIRGLIVDMKELLSKEEYGVALAACQVGEPLRLFIVSGRALARGKRNAPDEVGESEAEEKPVAAIADQVYINPEFVKVSRKKIEKHEGCLSVRGKWGMVPRAEKATLRAYDENGIRFERGAAGFLAHIFQHEMDHLDGVLYIEKATELYDDAPDTHDED